MNNSVLSSENMCFGVLNFNSKRKLKYKKVSKSPYNEKVDITLEDEFGFVFECETPTNIVLGDFSHVVTLLCRKDKKHFFVIDSNGKVDLEHPVEDKYIEYPISLEELGLDTWMFMFEFLGKEAYSIMSSKYVGVYGKALAIYCVAVEIAGQMVNSKDPICI